MKFYLLLSFIASLFVDVDAVNSIQVVNSTVLCSGLSLNGANMNVGFNSVNIGKLFKVSHNLITDKKDLLNESEYEWLNVLLSVSYDNF